MSACHGERVRVLQRVRKLQQQLEEARQRQPADPSRIEQLQRELLHASEALAVLPDCSA